MNDRQLEDLDFTAIELAGDSSSKLTLRSRGDGRIAKRRLPLWLKLAMGLVTVAILSALVIVWLLQPANSSPVTIKVEQGASLSRVVDQLANQGVVRHAGLIKIYFKVIKFQPKLQAGQFVIAPRQSSIKSLFKQLESTTANTRMITFYPGATLNHYNSATDRTAPHREVLRKAGFNDEQIDQALQQRNHPLFKLLPQVDSLEGLIYGETYQIFSVGTTEQALKRTYDKYLEVIKKENLVELYQKQGLTLYQGIILASIVEREVNNEQDRPKVAQVFLKRYRQKMALGSDVTYQYASRLAGVANNLYIQSPFNTRQVVGLPPTPIATPSKSSLLAVAKPAATDYLYFVAGDDDKTYFAQTLQQHNQYVKQYCHKKCAVH